MKWEKTTLSLIGSHDRTLVNATVYGPIGVHRNPDAKTQDTRWSVTHAASGTRIATRRTMTEARALAVSVLTAVPSSDEGWVQADPRKLESEFLHAVFNAVYPKGHPSESPTLNRKLR